MFAIFLNSWTCRLLLWINDECLLSETVIALQACEVVGALLHMALLLSPTASFLNPIRDWVLLAKTLGKAELTFSLLHCIKDVHVRRVRVFQK